MKQNKKKKGFTIVELVIVIGVIGILTAVLVPTFINLNNKAQVSSDQSFVKSLNTQMAIREQEEGKNNTMFEAVKDAKDIGFDVEKLTPVDNRDLVWDSRSDRFALLDSDGSVFFSEGNWELNAGDEHKIWKIYASMPTEQKYSIYAKEGWEGTEVSNLQVGFDVGYNEGFENISYVGKEGAAKTVTIRTNGAGTTLTVNNAADTVYHYDLLGSADVIHTADSSYHEFGTAGFVQVASGRVVAEKGGSIHTVVLVDKPVSGDLPAVIENNGGTITNAYATSAELIAANNGADRSVQLDANEDVIDSEDIEDIKAVAIGSVTPVPEEPTHVLTEADIAAQKEGYKVCIDGAYKTNIPKETFFFSGSHVIKLIDNTDLFDLGLLGNASVELDLNGYGLVMKEAMYCVSGTTLTIKDSSGIGGVWSSDCKNYGYGLIACDCTLNIYGGNFDATGFDGPCVGYFGSDGVVNIYGGMFTANAGSFCIANLTGINIYGGIFDATAPDSTVFNFKESSRTISTAQATIVSGSTIYLPED